MAATENMSSSITEESIKKRLNQAMEAAGPSLDGYAEIDLNQQTRLKCAAVLVPLVWMDEDWHLLFTRRTERVESHKGQVSFPGGACDEGESTPEETALREAEEEIGGGAHGTPFRDGRGALRVAGSATPGLRARSRFRPDPRQRRAGCLPP